MLRMGADIFPVIGQKDNMGQGQNENNGGDIGGQQADFYSQNMDDDQCPHGGIDATDDRPQKDPGGTENEQDDHPKNEQDQKTEDPDIFKKMAADQFHD